MIPLDEAHLHTTASLKEAVVALLGPHESLVLTQSGDGLQGVVWDVQTTPHVVVFQVEHLDVEGALLDLYGYLYSRARVGTRDVWANLWDPSKVSPRERAPVKRPRPTDTHHPYENAWSVLRGALKE